MIAAIRKLFGVGAPSARRELLPEGLRVYAVGDVHGRADLLAAMLDKIAEDMQERPVPEALEVFLGDYVDRGPDSSQVIETLMNMPAIGGRRYCLRGNHEEILLDFLAEPGVLMDWRRLGGFETLLSYGVAPRMALQLDDVAQLRDEFLAAVPPGHLSFLRSTQLSVSVGEYFFVHAGIRPGTALEAQKPEDLLWIRDPFLFSQRDHGKIVVHGHTPSEEPEVLANRINVDTGAFLTGRLTCAVLEGQDLRFLDTRSRGTERRPESSQPMAKDC
ncbi:MAG: metallophosphoesterase family protein [Aestuariivirgaceae bacterium]